MNFTRDSHGKDMGFSRERHEKHMGKTWEEHGVLSWDDVDAPGCTNEWQFRPAASKIWLGKYFSINLRKQLRN